MAEGSGTATDPWVLTTAPGSSTYLMYADPDSDPPALVCQVGSTTLRYHLSAVEDLHRWLVEQGGWVDLGAADEKKDPAPGTVEAWGRSPENPVAGWYGLRNGYRGRFGMYLPPLLEAQGLCRTHSPTPQQPDPRPSQGRRASRRQARKHRGLHSGGSKGRLAAQRRTCSGMLAESSTVMHSGVPSSHDVRRAVGAGAARAACRARRRCIDHGAWFPGHRAGREGGAGHGGRTVRVGGPHHPAPRFAASCSSPRVLTAALHPPSVEGHVALLSLRADELPLDPCARGGTDALHVRMGRWSRASRSTSRHRPSGCGRC